MDKKVDDYIENLPSPQKEICTKVREIILGTFPDLEESFKNGVPWYEDKFYIGGLKEHVNIGFSIKGLSEEELNLFKGSGKLMHSTDQIDESRIVKLLKMVK